MWPQGTQPLLQHGDDKDGCICAQKGRRRDEYYRLLQCRDKRPVCGVTLSHT
uniref:Uncharacterized protein n=1 Tax=Anguilla anguilla TaxID=7936 RepID=A0A0E9RZD6_ANGAN